MTLADLLANLRQELLDARANDDTPRSSDLLTTFDVLLEVAYQSNDRRLCSILQDLVDSARDSAGREYWKSTVPTEEEIRQACGN